MDENQVNSFAVSVARAIGRHPVTKQAIFYGTANATTALNMSGTATDIRGGITNPIIYRWVHDRMLTVSINKPTFEKDFLALNTGGQIYNDEVYVMQTDCLRLDEDGNGELAKVPVDTVSAFLPNNTVLVVQVGADKKVSIPSAKGSDVTFIYSALEAVDVLAIDTRKPPAIIELTLIVDIRDQNGTLVELLHVHLPKFQIDGNYELSLSADGVSTESLNGTALTVKGNQCKDGDTFGYFYWQRQEEASVSVAEISALPAVIQVESSVSTDQVQQLEVLGLRSPTIAPVDITDKCIYALASDPAPSSGISVDETGLVKIAQGTDVGESATVVVTYISDNTSYEDTVEVEVE